MNALLQPGDHIGIIAPSRWLKGREEIALGLKYLQDCGLKPVLGKHLFETWRFMAGTPQHRAEDIMDFYRDPRIKALFCACGGDGAQYLLPLLDYNTIKANPKPIFGFSDNTALQLGIYAQTGQTQYSGFLPSYNFRSGKLSPQTEQSLKAIFENRLQTICGGETVIPGKVEGKLVGGCLSLFRNLCGTPYFPDLRNSILLIEDEEETTYKIDLMLQQLSQNPGFRQIRGIIFGQFYNCTQRREDDGSIDDVISEFVSGLNIPILKNFPYGHGNSHHILPLGGTVRLDAGKCCLEYGLDKV